MFKKLLFVLLLAAVAYAGVLSFQTWQHKTELIRQQDAAAEQVRLMTQEAQTERQEAINAERVRLMDECQIGLSAYEALSSAEQKSIKKPVCDLQEF